MLPVKKVKTGELEMEKLQELSRIRPLIFIAFLLIDWMWIGAGLALFAYFKNFPSFLVGSVMLGIGQHGLLILGHEAVHNRLSNNKFLNEFVGNFFCYVPLFSSVHSYRTYHLPHHRDPFGPTDPEVPLRKAIGKSFEPPFSMGRAFKLWALSFVGFSLKEMYYLAKMSPKPTPKEGLISAVFWAGAVFVSYKVTFLFLPLWVYALSTTYISKLRLQAWLEHGLDSMDTSRYALPSHFFRYITPHNIWVHYEHHKYPGVPFYNLEKVRALEAEPRIYTVSEVFSELNTQASYYSPKKDKAA